MKHQHHHTSAPKPDARKRGFRHRGTFAAALALAVSLGSATASTSYNTTVPFDDPVPLGATDAPGVWFPDRYPPAAFESFDLSGENVLRIGIDGVADGSANRGGQSGSFYNTQGRKLTLPDGAMAIGADVYFPTSWEGAGVLRRTDVWATALNASEAISFYPIMGVANLDGTPILRYWDGLDWVNTAITPVGDTWYRLEMILEDDELVYLVDGTEVARLDSNGTAEFSEVMLQAYNFNDPALDAAFQSSDSYDAYWDDLAYAYPTVTNVTQATTHATLADALAAATNGDVLELSPGTYSEAPVTINKSVTINGANAGLEGKDAGRGAESVLLDTALSIGGGATVLIDGVRFLQTNTTANAVLINTGTVATLTNSVIERQGAAAGASVRGITTAVGAGDWTISNNLFTGDSSGGFFSGHVSWNSGMYVNGGSGDITDNCFENCRTALNLDDFNAGITISGNDFSSCGSYLSFGGTTPTGGSFTIAGNDLGIDLLNPASLPSAMFNLSNVDPAFRLDATGNTFGGLTPGALTNSDKVAIEARTYHRGRSGRNGVVDFVPNQQVVYLTSIQDAIDAASSGDGVLVFSGTYVGNLNIDKPLLLEGFNTGINAVSGTRTAETIIEGRVTAAADGVTVDGCTITNPSDTIGVFANNRSDLTVSNNIIHDINTGGAGSASGVYVDGDSSPTSGFVVTDNLIYNIGSPAASVSTKGIYFGDSSGSSIIDDVLIQGNSISGVRSSRGAYGITPNYGVNNGGSVTNLEILNNTVSDLEGAWANGISLDTDTPGAVVRNNQVSDLRDGNMPSNTAGLWIDGNPSGATLTVERNIFRSDMGYGVGVHPNDITNFGYTLDASANYWDDPTGPSGEGSGTGVPVGPNVTFSPWYADEARTILVTPANFADAEVPAGSAVTETDLYIGFGSTYTVRGTLEVTGDLNLAEGATLEVIDGELVINGSVFSGTFTFFDSMGSVNFNDDVSIAATADGLMLVSDVHVADGATVTVSGTLVIDGCLVDSPGTFDLVVDPGADFTMARTIFTNGAISSGADDTAIYDNEFVNSTVEITAGTNGAEVYHNLTDNAGFLTDGGTGTVTTVDSWGNVTAPVDTENNLALALDISALGATRTVDGDGNVYIQPTDSFTGLLEVSDLQAKIAAVETLLGYNTNLLSAGSLALEPDWNVSLTEVDDDTDVIGKLDAAIGLSFSFPDPSGSDADDTIATVVLTGEGTEGRTRFFQRVKLSGDAFPGDTRLTTGGGSPAYLAPFTSNTSDIILDGTAPVIAEASIDGEQDQASFGTVDVLDASPATAPNFTFRNGNPVILTFTATDTGGSDLDPADATNDLSLTADNGTTVLDSSNYTVTAVESGGVVTYTVTLDVPVTSTTGTYAVTATVLDRSGNESALADLGSFVLADEILVDIELQAFTGGTREVTFLGTDAGGTVIDTWIRTVSFTGPTGSIGLEDVSSGVVALSAKTDYNLRSKIPLSFSGTGVASADLTGTDLLPGGDLNGDNIVNTLDYATLRFEWGNVGPAADIDGNAAVNLDDFNLLRANFYSVGDAE